MKILITGASGYIGQRLVRLAQLQQDTVVFAGRQKLDIETSWFEFDLKHAKRINLPSDIDAVIHLAADTRGDKETAENEFDSACELIYAAKKTGAKFVFVSSQTAGVNAPTQYGQTKWRIEKEVLAAHGYVVRPGQVYGGPERGLFGTLVGIVRKFPIIPYFFPAPHIQPIHVDDLACAILKLTKQNAPTSRIYFLGATQPVSFTHFLKLISTNRLRRHRGFIPIPTFMIKAGAFLIGQNLSAKLGVARIQSLFSLSPMETATDLEGLGMRLRNIEAGLHPSGNGYRRLLLQEAQTILKYILREKPSSDLIRRYSHMVERLRNGMSLGLPLWTHAWPSTLALIDVKKRNPTDFEAEIRWRIDAATLIAESSPQGAYRFLGTSERPGWQAALFGIITAVINEIFWRTMRPFASTLKCHKSGFGKLYADQI